MRAQHIERLVDGQPEMAGQLADLLVAQRIAQLIRADRQIGAAAEPRRDLVAEAALLQLCDDAVEVSEIALRQGRGDERRHCAGCLLAEYALKGAANVVEQSHVILLAWTDDRDRRGRRARPTASWMLLVLGGAVASCERVLLAHVRAFLGLAVVLVPAEVIDL